MTGKTLDVDYYEWHRLRNVVEDMQGHTFYREDEEGSLKRWYPPRRPKESD